MRIVWSSCIAAASATFTNSLINDEGFIHPLSTAGVSQCLKNLKNKRILLSDDCAAEDGFTWSSLPLDGDIFQVKSDTSAGVCWQIDTANRSGSKLRLKACNADEPRQHFRFTDGIIYHAHTHKNLCLTAPSKRLKLKKCLLNRFGSITAEDTETTSIATTVATSTVENQECEVFRAKEINSDNKCLTLQLSFFMNGCDPLTGNCTMINHPIMKDCKGASLNQQLIHNTTSGQIATMKGTGKCLSILAHDQATWEVNRDPCEEHSDEYMTGSYVYFFDCQAEAVPWQRFNFDGVYLRSGCPHNYALADAFPFISAENPDEKLDSTTFLQLEKQCL